MNISKFTQKSLQAVQDLEKTAYEFGNQEVEQEHLLYNHLHQEDSLILKLIEKMEIQKEHFLNNVERALNARTKVSGGQPYIGQYLNKALRMRQKPWETNTSLWSICFWHWSTTPAHP